MVNYCPSYGSKVEEGFKFCLNCGGQLQQQETVDSGPPKNKSTQTQSISTNDPVPITPQTMRSAKSNKKLIVVIIAIVTIIIVIAAVVFLFLGSGADSRFVGVWELEGGNGFTGSTMTFEGDGDWKMGYLGASFKVGTWNVQGDDFCLKMTNELIDMGQIIDDIQCYQYEFSNNGNTLALTVLGEDTMVLTKT